MTTTKAVAHRVGQARGLAVRAQLAWMLTQLVFWLSVIGGVVAAVLWARRRLTAGAQTGAASTAPSTTPSTTQPTDEVTNDTSPAGLP